MRALEWVVLVAAVFAGLVVTGVLKAVDQGSNSTTQPAKSSGSTSRPASRPTTQPAGGSQPAGEGAPLVIIDSSFGQMVVELDVKRTPKTAANFLRYVDEKFYDGLTFHRVMQGFMIQGGWLTPDDEMKQPTHPPVVNESRNAGSNQRGTIAMARTNAPNSATSQFFINTVDNKNLDFAAGHGGYCAFGKVVEGMEVADKIAAVPVRQSRLSNAQPIEPVLIRSVYRKPPAAGKD